jgi:beta-lactamase class A
MVKRISWLAAAITISAGSYATPAKEKPLQLEPLKAQLNAIAKKFNGRLGYSLKVLRTGQQIGWADTERFPSASTIKTAVMVEALAQVDEGKLKWTDKQKVPSEPGRRESSMWAYFLRDGVSLDLDGWVNLMITVSDNTATIVTRDWVGTMNVNKRMESLGLLNTKILGNAPKDNLPIQRLRRQFGMGMTTPSEMVRLFELIHLNKAGTPAACDKMLRILGHQYWDDFIGSSVPPDVKIACKSGAITRSRSDTAIVYGPEPYILAIYTDSQKDRRWVSDNEGDLTIKKMSNVIWNALNPTKPYTMPAGSEKFAPTGSGVEDSG